MPKRSAAHIPAVGSEGLEDIYIPIVGPPGLRVEGADANVSVRVMEDRGEGKKLVGPVPPDPYVVSLVHFRDVRHLQLPSGRRRARDAARKAARRNQQFGIVVTRATVLPRETLVVIHDIGRKAGVPEVPLYVKRLK